MIGGNEIEIILIFVLISCIKLGKNYNFTLFYLFGMMSAWFAKGVLVVNGFLHDDGSQVCIINVYAPCLSAEKLVLWDLIRNVIMQQSDTYICVVGDFNAIRREDERRGRSTVLDHRDMSEFNDFIALSNLIELPLRGRFFTWYRKDGSCMCKLDRILVSEEWMNNWLNHFAKSCGRSFSDHCPIFIESVEIDWGPRPFRFINSWVSNHINEMIRESIDIFGRETNSRWDCLP